MIFGSVLERHHIHRQFLCVAATVTTAIVLSAFAPDAAAAGGSIAIPSSGKSLGTISSNVTASLRDAAVLVTMLAYLGAVVFGFLGALKWKAYGEQPDRTPVKIPITYWGIAAILAALPEFLGTGVVTLWGSGAAIVQQP